MPHNGIKYVRIHYLFDLINLLPPGVEVIDNHENFLRFGADATEYLVNVGLNFTALDKAMDQLQSAGLFPGFEVMGNPGNNDDRSDRLVVVLCFDVIFLNFAIKYVC